MSLHYYFTKQIEITKLQETIGKYIYSQNKSDFNIVKQSIDYCIDKYGDDYNIFEHLTKLFTRYIQYDMIDNIIEYILTKNIQIDEYALLYGSLIGNYRLIKVSLDINYYCLMNVIKSNRSEEEIIRIIDLFCENGFNIDEFATKEKFFITSKLNVIKNIVEKTKELQLDRVCNNMYIIKCRSKIKDFKNVINYMIDNYKGLDNSVFEMLCGGSDNGVMYTYLISRLMINGGFIRDDVSILRRDAIDFVREVSEYILPDIANVVFDYSYTFNCKEHYNLAHSI